MPSLLFRIDSLGITASTRQVFRIKYNTGDNSRYIPFHTLAQRSCEDIFNTVLKIHVFIGCDATSKAGTKAATLKASNQPFSNQFRAN